MSITEVREDRTGLSGAQLARLPRFGLKKFSKLKGAFVRTLRTGAAGGVLPTPARIYVCIYLRDRLNLPIRCARVT